MNDDFSIQYLIDLLNDKQNKCRITWIPQKCFELGPWDYFYFTRDDLQETHDRARINALSNAKRAIECRTDEILILLNLEYLTHKKYRRGIPYKLDVLRSIGISAPDILKGWITQKRNTIEHDYNKPEEYEQIRRIADIVELFLKSTDQFVKRGQLYSFEVNHKYNVELIQHTRYMDFNEYDNDKIVVKFDHDDNKLSIETYTEHYAYEHSRRTGSGSEQRKKRNLSREVSYHIGDIDENSYKELIKSLHSHN